MFHAASGEVETRPGILELFDEARDAGLKVGVCSAATKSSAVCVLENLLGPERFKVGFRALLLVLERCPAGAAALGPLGIHARGRHRIPWILRLEGHSQAQCNGGHGRPVLARESEQFYCGNGTGGQ